MTGTLKIPLDQRPKVVKCGLAEHGLRGREEYLLPRLWCLHLYFYEVRAEIAGQACQIKPGSLTLIPPRTRIVYHYTGRRCRHFFVHFGLKESRASAAEVPLCRHLPHAQDELLDRLQNMQRLLTREPLHAEVAFWALLWDVAAATIAPPGDSRGSPDLAGAAEELIEAGLPGHLTVGRLAAQLGFSATHLNRALRAAHGLTTVQLIRKRRLRRAYHLLLHSTMPIKLVAAECGITDLQKFNKLMRHEYGDSPRALRLQDTADPTWATNRI
ncbi:hypothetical protein BH09VER1_BH09VER1_34120 [soil metagenome]